jgi:hypothetical protein
MPLPRHPRRHLYPTFEYELVLKHCEDTALSVAEIDIITTSQPRNTSPTLYAHFMIEL